MSSSQTDSNAASPRVRRGHIVATLAGLSPAVFFVIPLALGDVGELVSLVSCYVTPVLWIVSFFYICSPGAWPARAKRTRADRIALAASIFGLIWPALLLYAYYLAFTSPLIRGLIE